MMSVLLKNVRAGAVPSLSYVAATPKPRLVKLEISTAPPRIASQWDGVAGLRRTTS